MATYNYPSSVIENAPRTNVGIVPFNRFGYDEYFAPRDPSIKDYLNYSAYENVKGIPQLGIQDQLRRKQGGTYNTELNPYNPSSKFFPHEQNLAGIMGIKAYEQQGQPVLQKDLGETSGEYRPFDQEISINPFKHALKKDDKGVPQLELNPAQDPDEVRETLFHEGKHFFIDKFGKLIPKTGALSDEDEHKLIWFYEDMFTPGYEKKDFIWSLNKKQAEAWMEMQDLARKWSKNQTKFTGGKEKGRETWERLIEERSPNITYDQAKEQYEAYRDPNRGNVQTPTMSQQAMVEEAQRTGGTVNPHEATKAVSRPRQPVRGPHGYQEGGPVRQQQYQGLNNPQQDMTQIQQQQEKDFIQRWCGTGSLPIFQPPPVASPNTVPQDQWGQLKNPWGYMGQQMGGFGEQLGGFGETLGGYKEQIGGFGEQLGGFGEQLGGFKGQFENIDSRLQNMEKGITSLTDKMGVQQQAQNPFQGVSSFGFGGFNPFYGGYSYFRGGGPVKKPSLFQKLFDYGKNVASMQLGGGVTGAGTGKSDSIPAMLSDGEFVMTAKSVKGMGGGNREKGFKKLNTMMKSAEARAV